MKTLMKKIIVIIVMITIVVLGVKAQNTYADVKGPTEDSIIYKHLSIKDTDFSNVKIFECKTYGGIKASGSDKWYIENIRSQYKRGNFSYKNISNVYYETEWIGNGYVWRIEDSLIWETNINGYEDGSTALSQNFKNVGVGISWSIFSIYAKIDTVGIVPGDTLEIIGVNFSMFCSGKGTLHFDLGPQYLIYGERQSTGIKENKKPEVKVYPNPFTDQIKIEGKFKKFTILNSLGQIVSEGNNNQNNQIETSNLTRGIYFIKIDNHFVKEMIKD